MGELDRFTAGLTEDITTGADVVILVAESLIGVEKYPRDALIPEVGVRVRSDVAPWYVIFTSSSVASPFEDQVRLIFCPV